MAKHRVFFAFVVLELLLLAALFGHGRQLAAAHDRERIPPLRSLVAGLGLTDLSLWTEARYTRHPSQADLFTPFQEFPAAPEHFPAGSILAPPPHLGRGTDRDR